MHRMLFYAARDLIDGINNNDFGSMAMGGAVLALMAFGWFLLHSV